MNVRKALPKIHFDQTQYRKANTCVFAIISHLLPFPRIPSPTYIPSLAHLSYLAYRPLASPPLPSHPLPYPVPYPTISLRTLPPLPYYTLPSTSLPSHPLSYLPTLAPLSYPCIPYLPLPSHLLPCPLLYPTISILTGLGAETFPSLPLP